MSVIFHSFASCSEENIYDKRVVLKAAKFHGANVVFSENAENTIITVPAPQTQSEYGHNYKFWQWFFNCTMRNFGLIDCVHSCVFLNDWQAQTVAAPTGFRRLLKMMHFPIKDIAQPATGARMVAVVGLTISVYNGIRLQLSESESNRLKLLGVKYLERVKDSAFPYQLLLGGNIIEVKLKK